MSSLIKMELFCKKAQKYSNRMLEIEDFKKDNKERFDYIRKPERRKIPTVAKRHSKI